MTTDTVEAGTALAASLLRSSGPLGRAIRLGAAYAANLQHGATYAAEVQRVALALYQQANTPS